MNGGSEMRKVVFKIDDEEFFKQEYKDQLTEKQWKEFFKDTNPFKAIYTLIGDKEPDRYELTDFNGNKININNLNGYQRGVVLNDCMSYFTGGKYYDDADKPCGVIDITEVII